MENLVYNYNREFPMPFSYNEVYIYARNITALMWMTDNISDDFKKSVIDKLNGKSVNFDGDFFIGNNNINNIDKEYLLNQCADADNKFLYFWKNNEDIAIKIAMVRGWGHLTGIGGLNLPSEKAAEIQDGFLNWIKNALNFNFETGNLIITDEYVSENQEDIDKPGINPDNMFQSTDNEDDTQETYFKSYSNIEKPAFPKLDIRTMQRPWWEPCLNKKRKNKR